jgi:serine phosphatase RsbU (regulator of sigma subunit)
VDGKQAKGSYYLVAQQGDRRRVPLFPQGPMLVGRGAHNHLVLNDYRISRQHARVTPEQDGFVVYDLNSANGTFVNGDAVRRRQLTPQDEVSFGPISFKLEFQAEETPSRPHPHLPQMWRARESVTRFNRVPDPRVVAPEIKKEEIRKTIPPEVPTGAFDVPAGAIATVEDFGPHTAPQGAVSPSNGPPSSSHFEAEAAVVDLNLLEDAYDKLGTLYGFMQAISKTLDRNELLELIAAKLREIYPQASSVGVYLRSPDDGPPFVLTHLVGVEVGLPSGMATAILRDRRSMFGAEARGAMAGGMTMYAPMIDRDETLGVICVAADPRHGGFTAADLQLLTGVTTPAAIILQNTRMHEQSLQRERLNRDLELAGQIQKSFLPQEVYAPGFEFLATYDAAYTVGGDFYDVFWVDPNRLAVFVGDITGKGIAAAILMARISGELRVAALAHIDPVAVFSIMNKALIGRGQPELFFTAVYFTLDVRTGEVTIATAGHPPPYLCRADGSVWAITEGASGAVGMLEDPEFVSTRFMLERGDSLVLYTDGVVEAADTQGRLYGEKRLVDCLAQAGSRPQNITDHLLRSIRQHTRNAAASDDLTLFVCHRSKGRHDPRVE